jgi:hypothetical protein
VLDLVMWLNTEKQEHSFTLLFLWKPVHFICSFFILSCRSKYIDIGHIHLYYYQNTLMIVV